MTFLGFTYFTLFIYILLSFVIALIIFGISYLLAFQNPESSKLTSYECGFDPLGDSRECFNVQYYLVAILFLLFDLEISFLFPWAIVLKNLSFGGVYIMFVFLGILVVGFIYEWKKSALEWS